MPSDRYGIKSVFTKYVLDAPGANPFISASIVPEISGPTEP
jgi:hypothetical protein